MQCTTGHAARLSCENDVKFSNCTNFVQLKPGFMALHVIFLLVTHCTDANNQHRMRDVREVFVVWVLRARRLMR